MASNEFNGSIDTNIMLAHKGMIDNITCVAKLAVGNNLFKMAASQHSLRTVNMGCVGKDYIGMRQSYEKNPISVNIVGE